MKQNRMIMSPSIWQLCSVIIIVASIFSVTHADITPREIFHAFPVLSNAGGQGTIDHLSLHLFLGQPIANQKLFTETPVFQSMNGTGLVLWEHMLRSIHGQVFNTNYDPIPDVMIEARKAFQNDARIVIYGISYTNENGEFTIEKLPAIQDLVLAAYPSNESNYVMQFYANTDQWNQATPISTIPGNIDQIDFVLLDPPEIGMSGIISNDYNTAMQTMTVWLISESHQFTKNTQTNSQGEFQFTGIPNADDYHVYTWSPDYQTNVYYYSENQCVTDPYQATAIQMNDHSIDNITIPIRREFMIYYIQTHANAMGQISPDGRISLPYDASQKFSFMPEPGSIISDVLIDNQSIGPVKSYTFTHVISQGHTINVLFERPIIHILATENGTISPAHQIIAYAGKSQQLTFTPNFGYEIDTILIDQVPIGPVSEYILENIQSHHTIQAIFKPKQIYSIVFQIPSGGALIVHENESLPITITANQSPYTLQTFENQTLYCRILPYSGYYLNQTLINQEPSNEQSFIIADITRSYTIHVVFSPLILTSQGIGQGTIAPSGNIPLQLGQDKTFTITPSPGYIIQALIIDGYHHPPVSHYTFWNIQKPHTIQAIFEAMDTISITLTVDEGGTLTVFDYQHQPIQTMTGPTTSSIEILPQSQISLLITPAQGKQLANVIVGSQSLGASLEHTLYEIQSDKEMYIFFKTIPTQTIVISQTLGGQVMPSGTCIIEQGKRQQFNIIPDLGFHVKNVLWDNVSLGAIHQYIFVVNEPLQITHWFDVQFEQDPLYEVTGTVTGSGHPISTCEITLAFPDMTFTSTTNEHGEFTIVEIPANQNGVLWATTSSEYATTYYQDFISTQNGSIHHIHLELMRMYQGQICGTIHYSGMASQHPNVLVQGLSTTQKNYVTALTNEMGQYTLSNVQPGQYVIMVSDPVMHTDFYYSKQGIAIAASFADYVDLAIDAIANGIDITITPGGTIDGTVYVKGDSQNTPLQNIRVNARSLNNHIGNTALTDENGRYTITGLSHISQAEAYTETGYIVEVLSLNYPYQAYPQVDSPNQAQPVFTGIQHIDFFLLPTCQITGIITGPSHTQVKVIANSLTIPSNFSETIVTLSNQGTAPYTLCVRGDDDYQLTAYPSPYPVAVYPEPVDVSYGDRNHIHIDIPPGTTLTGTVTTSEGGQVANIPVIIHTDSNTLFKQATTDENGHYTISGLLTQSYMIMVDQMQYLPYQQSIDILGDVLQEYDIMLGTGYTLHGKISYHMNTVPGIIIEVASQSFYRRTVLSDADGFFYTVTGLLPGTYSLIISGETYQTIQESITVKDSDVTMNFGLKKQYRNISGIIYNMHANESAHIRAWAPDGSDKTMTVQALTDNEPVPFLMSGLLSSKNYILEVKSDAHPLHFYDNKFGLRKADRLNLANGDVTNLSFALVTPYYIQGIVTVPAFPMGLTSTQIVVHSTSSTLSNEGIATIDMTQPGQQSYTIPLLVNSHDYLVSVQSLNFVNHYFDNAREINATYVNTANPLSVDFTLTGGASISGTIVDTTNQPMPNLLVLAWSQKTGSQGSTHTQGDGSFIIRGLVQSDDFIVQAWNQNNVTFFYHNTMTLRSQKQTTLLSTVDSDITGIEMTIRNVQTLTGRITDKKNQPIEGVLISAESEITMSDGSTFTDKQGYYTIDSLLEGNDYVVRTFAENWHSQEKIHVATNTELNFMLDHKPTYSIQGRIIDDQQNPINHAKIELWSHATQSYLGNAVLTDKSGAYQIMADAPGLYTLMVSAPSDLNYGFTTYAFDIIQNTILLDIDMKPAYSITGKAIYSDKRPIINSTVILRSKSKQLVQKTITNGQGKYSFLNIPNTSDYKITVVPEIGVGQEKSNLFPGQQEDIVLYRMGYIMGKVIDKKSGQGLSQAMVIVTSKSKPDILGFAEVTYTDDNGLYRFNSLRVNDDIGQPVTDYIVTVSLEGYLIGNKLMRKTGDEVNIELEKDQKGLRRMTGTITSDSAYDFFIVMILKDGSHFERFVQTQANGYFEFDNLITQQMYKLSVIPYMNNEALSLQTIDQSYHPGDTVVYHYVDIPGRRNIDHEGLTRMNHTGDMISLKSLTHIPQVISNLSKISFNWEFNGLNLDLTGFYTHLNQSSTHHFNMLTVSGLSPITHRVYTSQEISSDGDRYYFHVAPVFIDGFIGETQSIGPFIIDTVPPSNVNVIVPEITPSLKINLKMGVTGAYEMSISPYNFGEGGQWEPWKKDKEWMLMDRVGKQNIFVQFRDRAGNIANSLAETIYQPTVRYTIRTEKMDGPGQIDPADPLTGEIQVIEGQSQTLSVLAHTGYEIYSAAADGQAIQLDENQAYTFQSIQKDHEFEVRFQRKKYPIQLISSKGGCIVPVGEINLCKGDSIHTQQVLVYHGEDQTVKIIPNNGYAIHTILVDNQHVSLSNNTYTFKNVIEDTHTVDVSFVKALSAPYISLIDDVHMFENDVSSAIEFTFYDFETDVDALHIDIFSSRSDLIPIDQIELKRQGQTGWLTFRPVANQHGSSSITIRVTDEHDMTSLSSFIVIVQDMSYAPRLSDLDDITIPQNSTAGPFDMTVWNQDPGRLIINLESTNEVLMPFNGVYVTDGLQTVNLPYEILVNGNDAYPFQLSMIPLRGQSGYSDITVTVKNTKNLTWSTSFRLTVTQVDHQPELSFIPNQIINQDTMMQKIPIMVSDPDGGSITLTGRSSSTNLISHIIFYNGAQSYINEVTVGLISGVDQTLHVAVQPHSGQSGACNIIIQAMDATNLTDETVFGLIVKSITPVEKIWYGFIYEYDGLGLNGVEVSVIEPKMSDLSIWTTQPHTAPDGRFNDGYFEFRMPVSAKGYTFNATKPGYYDVVFNSSPENIEQYDAHAIAFKSIYISQCEANRIIKGRLRVNGESPDQSIRVYVLGNNKVIATKDVLSDYYEICLGPDLGVSVSHYTVIASMPDYYTTATLLPDLPNFKAHLDLNPIQKEPLDVQNDETFIEIRGRVTLNPIGGEIILIQDNQGTSIGQMEIKVLSSNCVNQEISIPYYIIKSDQYDNTQYTNGSNKTLIQSQIQGQCKDFEMRVSIPIQSTAQLSDFQTEKYKIYAATDKINLLQGNYSSVIPVQDIQSVLNNQVTYRWVTSNNDSTIFGVGYTDQPMPCKECPQQGCIDCDIQGKQICFISTTTENHKIWGLICLIIIWIHYWVLFIIFRNTRRKKMYTY